MTVFGQSQVLKLLDIHSDPNNLTSKIYAYKKGPDKVFYRSLQKQEFQLSSWLSLPVFLFQLQQQPQRLTLGIAGNGRTP